MQAIHIGTHGIADQGDASLLDAILRMLAGVADVVAVRSLGLVSVLYDEHKTGPRTILATVRAAGFDATVLRPSTFCRGAGTPSDAK
jgi:hypothetical protein